MSVKNDEDKYRECFGREIIDKVKALLLFRGFEVEDEDMINLKMINPANRMGFVMGLRDMDGNDNIGGDK